MQVTESGWWKERERDRVVERGEIYRDKVGDGEKEGLKKNGGLCCYSMGLYSWEKNNK